MAFSIGVLLFSLMLFLPAALFLRFSIFRFSVANAKLEYAAIVAALVLLIRMLLPIEFPFSKTILVPEILPAFYRLLEYEVFGVSIFHIALILWAAIACFKLLRMALSYGKLRTVVKNARAIPFCNGAFPNVRVVVSELVSVPMTFGWRKCTIALPDASYTDAEFDFILKHELAHIRNRDFPIKIFSELVVCILWWNPIAYALRNAICALFEFRADRETTHNIDSEGKLQYVRLLIRMGKERQRWKNCLNVTGKKGEGNVLIRRVSLLLDGVSKKPHRGKLALVSLCILVAIAASGFIVLEPDMTSEFVKDTSFTLNAENAYLIHREGERYDLYLEGEFLTTLSMHESIAELPVLEANDGRNYNAEVVP